MSQYQEYVKSLLRQTHETELLSKKLDAMSVISQNNGKVFDQMLEATAELSHDVLQWEGINNQTLTTQNEMNELLGKTNQELIQVRSDLTQGVEQLTQTGEQAKEDYQKVVAETERLAKDGLENISTLRERVESLEAKVDEYNPLNQLSSTSKATLDLIESKEHFDQVIADAYHKLNDKFTQLQATLDATSALMENQQLAHEVLLESQVHFTECLDKFDHTLSTFSPKAQAQTIEDLTELYESMATDDSLDDLIANLKAFDQKAEEETVEVNEEDFVPEHHEGIIISEVRGSNNSDTANESQTAIFKDEIYFDTKPAQPVVTKKRGFFSKLLG